MVYKQNGVCIMPSGGKPQVITLMLDALKDHGEQFGEVILVHLAQDNPRYYNTLNRLIPEFADERYRGDPCHFDPQVLQLHRKPIAALDSEDAIDAVCDYFDTLFRTLKQQQRQIHLCLTGGPRLVGDIAMSLAQRYFRPTDRIWHIHSSDAVKEQAQCHDRLHAEHPDDVKLLRVRIATYDKLYHASLLSPDERHKCQLVYDHVSAKVREVLREIAKGLDDADICDKLTIQEATLRTYKTKILDTCATVWDSPPRKISWVVSTFQEFF